MRCLCLLAFVSAFSGCAAKAPVVKQPITQAVPRDTARAIEGAIEQYRQAYEVHSAEALGEMFAHDLDVISVYQGRTYQGWTQIQVEQKKRFKDATKVRMIITNLSIQSLGDDAAVATAGLERTIGDDATTVTERGSLTLVFRKTAGRWMIATEHFSYPTGPS